ncbi:MAG TPA: RNA polymerase sigma factor [Solirubrobacteraceae bacterium]|nr:RNA polymerase sigma factor [Solirubrobacteraceae bacterium]
MTTARIEPQSKATSPRSRLDFEDVYRVHVGALTAFFARRCREPQEVADLTSQTFVEAIRSAHTYRGSGSPRAWLIAIARAVYARRCAAASQGSELVEALGGQLELGHDEIEDLAARIDAQRDGRELLMAARRLSAVEHEAIELVDLTGLTPTEAAQVLDVSANVLRVRLFRAHSKLRKELKR